jgi:phenylalanyl-tRNA synthetase alpha chain
MKDQIEKIKKEIEGFTASTKQSVEEFRLQFISKKGNISSLFDQLKLTTAEEKKELGKVLNELKKLAEEKFAELQQAHENEATNNSFDHDLTLPPTPNKTGSHHPLNLTRYRIIEIFERLGFNVEDGPEIEDDWHNFTALNFPENHPAREMQDTFFIEKPARLDGLPSEQAGLPTGQEGGNQDVLLRTHTSNVQVRLMKNRKPPFRAIMPGRVYRNEAISARAHCFFHQVEGLYVDKNVGFSDLKQTLYHFAKEMFGKDTKIRLRPSYFPFTEPSAEIDISCLICHGKGCNVCKYSGWVEIAGSGMVHPNVLRNCGVDPEEYTGFAFGMGIERITMLRYGINDLRLFSENDIRFLKQFKAVI